jgi:molecular chaperone GrpE
MKDDWKGKKQPEDEAAAAAGNKAAEVEDTARQALKGLSREQLEDKVLDLLAKLQEKERKAGEFKDDLQRKQAELENYRKRMVREQTRIIDQANRRLIEQLLPVIDNLEKALQSSQASDDKLTEGVRMIYGQLMEVLKKEGLEEINPLGHPFDPEVCEAVMAVVSDNHEDETVVEVHQKGYRYKGNLVRPARASVSKCD